MSCVYNNHNFNYVSQHELFFIFLFFDFEFFGLINYAVFIALDLLIIIFGDFFKNSNLNRQFLN